jgi:hypothetical protein
VRPAAQAAGLFTRTEDTTRPSARFATWGVRLYPTAGEATIWWRAPERPQREKKSTVAHDTRHARSNAKELDSARSARRARGNVRRYCVHNELRYLWTLTQARQDHDRSAVLHDVQTFVRRLRRHLGGTSLPYVYVLETHKSDAWHIHIAIPKWILHSDIARLWRHGHVWVTDHGRRRRKKMDRAGQGVLQVAGYVAKYVSKAYEAGLGRQGYGVAEGFQPPFLVLWGGSQTEVRDLVEGVTTNQVTFFDLMDLDGYEGPPALWARWDP